MWTSCPPDTLAVISYLLDMKTQCIKTLYLINEQTTLHLLQGLCPLMVAVNPHVPKSVLLLYLGWWLLIWENYIGSFKSSWNARSCACSCHIHSCFCFIVLVPVMHCRPDGSRLTPVWVRGRRNTWSYEWWAQGLFLQMLREMPDTVKHNGRLTF